MKLDTIYSKLSMKNLRHILSNADITSSTLTLQYSTKYSYNKNIYFAIKTKLYYGLGGASIEKFDVGDMKFNMYDDNNFHLIGFCISCNGFSKILKYLYKYGRIDLVEKIMAKRCYIYFCNSRRRSKLSHKYKDYFDFIKKELKEYNNAH